MKRLILSMTFVSTAFCFNAQAQLKEGSQQPVTAPIRANDMEPRPVRENRDLPGTQRAQPGQQQPSSNATGSGDATVKNREERTIRRRDRGKRATAPVTPVAPAPATTPVAPAPAATPVQPAEPQK
jgi:hypothetical protein